jgi:hypothetical protein
MITNMMPAENLIMEYALLVFTKLVGSNRTNAPIAIGIKQKIMKRMVAIG